MRYFEEMTDKFGFGDGDYEPPDARAARDVYVRVINALAARNGSKVRALAWDRPGMHNSCMILSVSIDQMSPTGIVDTDDKMEEALAEARNLELDHLIHTPPPVVDAKRLAEILVEIEDNKREESK